jgi:hypothetical protein
MKLQLLPKINTTLLDELRSEANEKEQEIIAECQSLSAAIEQWREERLRRATQLKRRAGDV